MAILVEKSFIYPLLCWTMIPLAIGMGLTEGVTEGSILCTLIAIGISIKSFLWYRENGGMKSFLRDSIWMAIGIGSICLIFFLIDRIGNAF